MGREARANPFSADTARLINKEPEVVLDWLGRELKPNDEVILALDQPIVFKVLQIEPVRDPQAPPGVLMLDVITRQRFMVGRNVPVKQIVRVKEAAAADQPAVQPSEADVELTAPKPDAPPQES